MNKKRILQLVANKLDIGYTQTIVSDINFDLRAGDFVILLGKNGSGKSTLLKTLSSILSKKNGKIFINHNDFDILSNSQKSKLISIVLTDKINMPLTVSEVLQLGRQAYSNHFDQLSDKDKHVIEQVINKLQLKTLLNRTIQQLSDGERQKVMIGRSLVQENPIILLDEPTTHLDLENKAIIINLLKKISVEQKKIIILSTHDINLILPVANKIWVIDKSRLSEINNASELTKIFNKSLIQYDHTCHIFRLI